MAAKGKRNAAKAGAARTRLPSTAARTIKVNGVRQRNSPQARMQASVRPGMGGGSPPRRGGGGRSSSSNGGTSGS